MTTTNAPPPSRRTRRRVSMRLWLRVPCGARWYLDGRPWQRRIGAWWLPRYHSIGYWLEERSQETA